MSDYVTITLRVPFDELEVDYDVQHHVGSTEAWGVTKIHTETTVEVNDALFCGYEVHDWDDDEMDAACLNDFNER